MMHLHSLSSKPQDRNVRSPELLSKEWCDIVFEGRNQEYGAYQIRRRTGRRYRYALLVIVGAFAAMVLTYVGVALYVHYLAVQGMKNAEEAFAKYKPSELKDGYKVKFVATARTVPPVRMKPGAKQGVPEIVEGEPIPEIIGTNGPISYDPEQEVIVTPIVDTTGLGDETLPVAKQKIVPTEHVSELPDFPGGLRSFMKWMDENVSYPPSCINKKQQGLVTVSFIVGTDGYATDLEVKNAFDVQIYRSIQQAFKRMPQWKPGTDEYGQPTPVRVTIPVEFKI